MALPAIPFNDLLFTHTTRDSQSAPKTDVWIIAEAKLPTRFGDFRIVAFGNRLDDKDHVAIIRGDVSGMENIPVRVHSECLTGDVMGSLRCDCRDQLEAALKYLAAREQGIILYLRQE
ncbi:hypothetical protein KJ815_07205, partial [bacterium]|nr:hypothetical protein [bacterium]